MAAVRQAGEYLPKELTEQNKHADIHVAHAALPRRVGNEKMKSALYVSVETVEQADFLCAEGMIWQGSWYPCEPFCEGAQVKQCYRCYDYGHVARHCRARQICGWCAQGHIEADCPAKDPASEQQLRCVHCTKPHPAWHKECHRRQLEERRARDTFTYRPTRFLTEGTPGWLRSPTARVSQGTGVTQRSQSANPEGDIPLQSSSSNKKRVATATLRGRPSDLERAAKKNRKITDIFPGAGSDQ